MHGNVDTRLRKLADPAQASTRSCSPAPGCSGWGASDAVGAALDPERFVPAPGQGTLAIEARAADDRRASRARTDRDARALDCLLAERALARELGATCDTPLGAARRVAATQLLLRGWLGLPDGSALARATS